VGEEPTRGNGNIHCLAQVGPQTTTEEEELTYAKNWSVSGRRKRTGGKDAVLSNEALAAKKGVLAAGPKLLPEGKEGFAA